ncbi:hypothetical protein NBRC116584_22820 [Hydrogenophaga sp. 5NK40-0174]
MSTVEPLPSVEKCGKACPGENPAVDDEGGDGGEDGSDISRQQKQYREAGTAGEPASAVGPEIARRRQRSHEGDTIMGAGMG